MSVRTPDGKSLGRPTREQEVARRQRVREATAEKIGEFVGTEREPVLVTALDRGRRASAYVGLNDRQRSFLYNRPLCETDTECAKLIGVAKQQVSDWKRESTVFAQAYAALWASPEEFTVNMLEALLPKSVEILEAAMYSPKERLRAVEMIMKSKGILKPERQEEDDSFLRRLAIQMHERGKPLPPDMRKYVDAEFREIPDDDGVGAEDGVGGMGEGDAAAS